MTPYSATCWIAGLGGELTLVIASGGLLGGDTPTGKFALFTGACLAVAGGLGVLGPAIARFRREQAQATEGTDRQALVKLRADYAELSAELSEARQSLRDVRADLRETQAELKLARAEAVRVTSLMVDWARWRLEEAPEVGPIPPPPGPDRTILPTTALPPESPA